MAPHQLIFPIILNRYDDNGFRVLLDIINYKQKQSKKEGFMVHSTMELPSWAGSGDDEV